MAAAFVQGPAVALGSGVTSLDRSFSSTPTAGNLVVVGISAWGGGGDVSSVVDNQGNTYDLAESDLTNNFLRLYYAKNIASSGTYTVTVNYGAAAYTSFGIDEYSGCDTATPLEATNKGTGSSTSPSSGAASSAAASAAYVGIATYDASTTIAPAAGWTERQENEDNVSYQAINIEDKISTGSQTATWTLGTSAGWQAIVAVFKEVAAGGQPAMRRWGMASYLRPVEIGREGAMVM